MRKLRWLLPLFTVLLSFLPGWADYSAEIHEKGSQRQKRLYHLDVKIVPQGAVEVITATYTDPEGRVVVIEKNTLQGAKLLKAEIDQRQLGATGLVEVEGQKVKFTKTQSGKATTEEETVKGDLVMPGNFQRYAHQKWKELMDGKSVNFRLAAWERQETVGFSLKKIGAEGEGPQQKVTIRMKPSNFLVAALVDPLVFKFDAKGERILEFVGRVAPKIKKGSRWADFDGDVVYKY